MSAGPRDLEAEAALYAAFQRPIGILDPYAENINPLTLREYEDPDAYRSNNWWTSLPVYEKVGEVLDSLDRNNVTLIRSGTGSGKTVLVPRIVSHYLGYTGKVITTIPKRILVKSSAKTTAEGMGVRLGKEVGYFFSGRGRWTDDGPASSTRLRGRSSAS